MAARAGTGPTGGVPDPLRGGDVVDPFGSALIALGAWATFTTWKTLGSRGGWAEHRTLVVLGVVFVASCLLPGIARLAGAYRSWMLVPLGLTYLALIPFPCYFSWANRGRMRTARALVFVLVGLTLVAAGVGLLPGP